MRAQSFLTIAAGALGVALIAQLAAPAPPWRVVETSPSWAHLAQSRTDAERFSDAIVLARVGAIESGLTLTHVVPGAGYDDRIPFEIVNLTVERVVRARPGVSIRPGGTVRLFHTALVSADAQPDPARDPAAPPAPVRTPEEGSQRSTLLEDDPPYATGERYLFYLAQGPLIQGAPTFAVFAPEGRYLILNQVLHAQTKRGFAPTLDGRRLNEVVADQPKRPRVSTLLLVGGGVLLIDLLSHPRHPASRPVPRPTPASRTTAQPVTTRTPPPPTLAPQTPPPSPVAIPPVRIATPIPTPTQILN